MRPPEALGTFLVPVMLLAAVGLTMIFQPAVARPPVTYSASVVRVKDGDTVVLRHQGHDETVRLADIDCPEAGQAFGHEATRRTVELTRGKEVRVLVVTRDKYGRRVATIYLPDATCLNRKLVEDGFAWRFDRYCQDPELLQLQERARAAGLGLWADAHPVPPWEYRHRAREQRPSR